MHDLIPLVENAHLDDLNTPADYDGEEEEERIALAEAAAEAMLASTKNSSRSIFKAKKHQVRVFYGGEVGVVGVLRNWTTYFVLVLRLCSPDEITAAA